jgi:hypothetical protein
VVAPLLLIGLLVAEIGDPTFDSSFFLIVVAPIVTAQTWWVLERKIWRVETDDDTIRFVGRRRVVELPWSELRAVNSVWPIRIRPRMIYWLRDGGLIRTWGGFEDLPRLVATIRRNAPDANVSGF